MDTISWELEAQVDDSDSYEASVRQKVPSFREYLRSEGTISVTPDAHDDIQLAGFCTDVLARTPILYNASIRLPMSIFSSNPGKRIVVRVHHDELFKLYDRELFAVDANYCPQWFRAMPDEYALPSLDARISRSASERLASYDEQWLNSVVNLRENLDARGWLSLHDRIQILILGEGEPMGTSPAYVGDILAFHYKRELTEKLEERIYAESRGTLCGPAARAAQRRRLARNN